MSEQGSAYRDAGVDIDAKYDAVRSAADAIRSTFTKGVASDVGLFGGVFDLAAAGVEGQLLIASTDGVGTKVKVAQAVGMLDGIGQDLVNHCVDDILVQGARPLFFLDYVALGKMVPDQVRQVIGGLAHACRQNGCALLGGETAEMPGVYVEGEMDVAGTIVGAVPRERLLDGSRIAVGDQLIGLASSGLHTNGYSLARKITADVSSLALEKQPGALGGQTVGAALLAVHRSYLPLVAPLLDEGLVHGMAHITGGGLFDNVPRVLPAGVAVRIHRERMPRPPIFDLLVAAAGIAEDEAYRVFNMGFGMVLIVAAAVRDQVLRRLADAGETAYAVGDVVAGDREVQLQ
ncbi:MAG: phosphoribosylformylglycinamidine cyclo-ligase [Planctomycetota bacterium]